MSSPARLTALCLINYLQNFFHQTFQSGRWQGATSHQCRVPSSPYSAYLHFNTTHCIADAAAFYLPSTSTSRLLVSIQLKVESFSPMPLCCLLFGDSFSQRKFMLKKLGKDTILWNCEIFNPRTTSRFYTKIYQLMTISRSQMELIHSGEWRW